jgi:hypothetical protein
MTYYKTCDKCDGMHYKPVPGSFYKWSECDCLDFGMVPVAEGAIIIEDAADEGTKADHWWCEKDRGYASPAHCEWVGMGGNIPAVALGHVGCGYVPVLVVRLRAAAGEKPEREQP